MAADLAIEIGQPPPPKKKREKKLFFGFSPSWISH
jgi:hypothetical protein